jgi:hypothetical protein
LKYITTCRFTIMYKNRVVNISKYFFLLLFLMFFGSITFFNHTHIIDGYTIVHSHPFKTDKNGNPIHNHSSNGYLLVHLLTHFTTTLTSVFFSLEISYSIFRTLFLRFAEIFLFQNHLATISLRGPPEMIF